MLYNQNKINILIIISFVFSCILSTYYLNKYDKYSEYKNNKHPMIKIAVGNHWAEAQSILDDVSDGKSFWQSGRIETDEFLPQKLLALFYIIIGENLEENNITKTNNYKGLYLAIKSFFYFFTIYLLSKKLTYLFSQRKIFYIILFLCLLPDLFQYQSSFWNESLFFSFQILLIYFYINNNQKIISNFLIGIIIGLMYSISSEFILYIIFILIIYFLNLKQLSIKPIVCIMMGLGIVLSLIFASNNLKTGDKKVVNFGVKSAFYIYLVPHIISKSDNISMDESFFKLKKESKLWANENKIKYYDENNLLLKIESPQQNEVYLNYLFKKSVKTILKNPFVTIKHVLNKSLHTLALNPFYIKYFYEYNGKGEFLKTDTHKNLIPLRIIYSIIIYLIILIGFFKLLRSKNHNLIIFLIISILYVILSLGWLGNPRYFTPGLIFMSIFFGNFFNDKKDRFL